MLKRIEVAAARRRLTRGGLDARARPQPMKDMGSDCLPEIEHIVILMMENHSYDNYLGCWRGGATVCRSTPMACPRRQIWPATGP